MRIPGQRHSSHCSTAPAGSQRLLPEPQQPPKLPSWGQLPSTRASALLDSLTTRSFPSAAAVGAAQGAQSPHPPPPSPPTHTSSSFTSTEHPQAQPPRSTPPQLPCICKVRGREVAATCCPTAGAPRVRAAVGSHDLLHRSASVRSIHCRTARPPPPPPQCPRHKHPAPGSSPA